MVPLYYGLYMSRAKTLSYLWKIELLFTLSSNWLYLGLTAIAQTYLIDSVRFFRQQSWNVIFCPSGRCFDDFYINNECSLIFCHVLPSIYISDSQVDYLEILDKSFCLLGKLYISLWLECGFQDSRRWVSSFSIFNAL